MLNLKYLWNIQGRSPPRGWMYCQFGKKKVAWQYTASSDNSDNCSQWQTLNDTTDSKWGKKRANGITLDDTIFKDLVRKEASVIENDIYIEALFLHPPDTAFPNKWIMSATQNFLGKMSIYFSDAVIAQSTLLGSLSSYLWIGSILFSILSMVAKFYSFIINAFL